MEQGVALSTAHLAEAAIHMTIRLARLTLWLAFLMAHLAVWCLLLTAAWWWGWSSAAISSACLRWLSTNSAIFLSAAGLSGATVAGVYWRVARRFAAYARSGWLKRYMLKGLGEASDQR